MFGDDEELSERVIFPITEAQSNGIEDARFVEFNDEGEKHSTQPTLPTAAGRSAPNCSKRRIFDHSDDSTRRIGGAQ